MRLEALCRAIGISPREGSDHIEICSIETDSRKVRKGSLFVAIRGLHTDSHACIPEAIARGASCILVQSDARIPEEIGGQTLILACESTRRAVACLYHGWYGFPGERLKLIGVTGTNGKTSVTHMLRHILESAFLRCGLIGTVGCESGGRRLNTAADDPLANMTTPDPATLYRILGEMVADGVEYVLMEVSSHALALEKTAPLRFTRAVFTNLTPEHLDFHRTMEAYAEAKAGLFAASERSIVCTDSPYAQRMLCAAGENALTCSSEGGRADYTATLLRQSFREGVYYRLDGARASLKLLCPIPGRFSMVNSMLAAVTAMDLGLRPAGVKAAVAAIPGVKGRMERVSLGVDADFTVLIDYAHTPDALENLLRTARELCRPEARIILLFGCGGDRDTGKRPAMGRIASLYADLVILTSDNSRSEDPDTIIAEILSGMDPTAKSCIIPDRRQAILHAVREAREGDVVLLAGKGHEEYEITHGRRLRFSEREIVKEALTERQRGNVTRQNAPPTSHDGDGRASQGKESDPEE